MARVSAVTVVTDARRRPPSLGDLILHDIHTEYDKVLVEKLHTEQIINGLTRIPDSPWNKIRKGEKIDKTYMESKLRKYE